VQALWLQIGSAVTMPVEVLAALIGLGGASVAAIVQWLVARGVIRSENERLHRQLRDEFQLQQFTAWQSEFQSVMAELLAATDPEANKELQKERIIPLVLKAQLMLNPHFAPHAKVNDLVNKLALAVTGWQGSQDLRAVLAIHGALLDATRETLYVPGKLR
jgi:hypothetical protein